MKGSGNSSFMPLIRKFYPWKWADRTATHPREIVMKRYISPMFVIRIILVFALLCILTTSSEAHKKSLTLQSTCGSVEVVLTPSTGTYNNEVDVAIQISDNQCELSALGFDLFYDTTMFEYLEVDNQNCLTEDWSMINGYEINPGQVRVGGLARVGTYVQPGQNGKIVVVKLRVICQCGVCQDGQESIISIDSYVDHLESFLPQPSQGTFTMVCCSGDISLPNDEAGTWGDMVYIPVNIANNTTQISDFQYDFVYDPSVFEFLNVTRTSPTQDWTTLNWSQVSAGKVRIAGAVGSGTSIPVSSSVRLLNMKLMVKCVTYAEETYLPMQIERYRDGIVGMCPRPFETDFLYRPCPRLGDVNEDDTITPGDAQVTFEIYLGMRQATTAQLTTADANCSCPCEGKEHKEVNNCLSPWDAQFIFDHYLGIRVLPICCADYACGEGSSLNGDCSFFSNGTGAAQEKRMVYPLPTIARSTERVMIPVMIDNPEGVSNFGLEMYYPQDLLDYVGTSATPMTQGLIGIEGLVETPGVVRIEGIGESGIESQETGSLSVVVFQVREEAAGSAHIMLGNFFGDILDAKAGSSTFVCGDDVTGKERCLTLGYGRKSGGLLVVPVEVTDAFGMKAFGIEVKYATDKMTFLGVQPTELTGDFVAVDGNEVAGGVVRIGGYSMSGIQDMASGALVELLFQTSESGGDIEITRILDDLKDFLIIK